MSTVKSRNVIETIKTIIITALITAIVAFYGGVTYQKSATAEIHKQAVDIAESVSKSKN